MTLPTTGKTEFNADKCEVINLQVGNQTGISDKQSKHSAEGLREGFGGVQGKFLSQKSLKVSA